MINDIAFGSILAWAVPPEKNNFIEKIFGYAQNFFTKKKGTHDSIVLDKSEFDFYYEFEATTTIRISPFKESEYVTVYEINASKEVLYEVLEGLFPKLGRIYGIVQVFYFIYRWFFELFGLDIRRWYNPFGWFFLICSELIYLYLKGIAVIMKWNDLIDLLNEWRKDNFHCGDAKFVLDWMVDKQYVKIKIKGVESEK